MDDMSKSVEDRIQELESALAEKNSEVDEIRGSYDSLYRQAEEAQRNAAYYQGQFEAGQGAVAPKEVAASEEEFDFTDRASVERLISSALERQVLPRINQAEKYATDALQQTAGREVDTALKAFREKHPASEKIMDFERLVLMDASDEIRRLQDAGRPAEDIKAIALKSAEDRVRAYNKWDADLTKKNKERREKAHAKATVPEFFAAAGFEEAPSTPDTIEEAGQLLDKLLATSS